MAGPAGYEVWVYRPGGEGGPTGLTHYLGSLGTLKAGQNPWDFAKRVLPDGGHMIVRPLARIEVDAMIYAVEQLANQGFALGEIEQLDQAPTTELPRDTAALADLLTRIGSIQKYAAVVPTSMGTDGYVMRAGMANISNS